MISCPSCWSYISADEMMSSSTLRTLLDRAGRLPLHVSAYLADHLIEHLVPHMDRVRTLQVVFEDRQAENFQPCDCFGLFARPAPILEGLHVSADDNSQGHTNMPTLFGGCAPRLSRLFLSQHYVCATNRFPNLTHLYLQEQYTFSPDSLTQFLDFLEGSPRLEELVLEAAGPCMLPELPDVFPLPRSVTLSRLHSLVFRRCYWAIPACILRHVVPGPHVEIQIGELEQLSRTSELFRIFAKGAAFLRHLDEPTQLAVWCLDKRFSMRCATSSASVSLNIGLHYCLTGSTQGTLVSALLNELPSVLPLAGVTDFRMRVDRAAHIWAPAVRTLHDALPAVEASTLWLDPELNKRYWRSILTSKLRAPVFPRLRALHIVGALPNAWRPYWLMGLAISRAKHGRPLDELTFAVLGGELCVSSIVTWAPDKVHIGGQRMADFVKKLEFRRTTGEESGMSFPVIQGWSGEVEIS